MFKFTHSKGKLNGGLAAGAILGAVIPILATAATGGLAAVPLTLWLALGGAVSGLFAGNIELKSPVIRMLEKEAAKAGRSGGADG
jgi:predicted lipid-binding transport protein (Tim44 family)